ncbi:hypothetical protein D3C77_382870 [compost metagenome]
MNVSNQHIEAMNRAYGLSVSPTEPSFSFSFKLPDGEVKDIKAIRVTKDDEFYPGYIQIAGLFERASGLGQIVVNIPRCCKDGSHDVMPSHLWDRGIIVVGIFAGAGLGQLAGKLHLDRKNGFKVLLKGVFTTENGRYELFDGDIHFPAEVLRAGVDRVNVDPPRSVPLESRAFGPEVKLHADSDFVFPGTFGCTLKSPAGVVEDSSADLTSMTLDLVSGNFKFYGYHSPTDRWEFSIPECLADGEYSFSQEGEHGISASRVILGKQYPIKGLVTFSRIRNFSVGFKGTFHNPEEWRVVSGRFSIPLPLGSV